MLEMLSAGIDPEAPPRILFADDDLGTLKVFRYYAEKVGILGEYVTTAREIIEKVTEKCAYPLECYDCIVADVNYFDANPETQPRLTGITAIQRIQRSGCDVPVVFISGYSNTLLREQIKILDAELFVKPFDYEALLTRVMYLVAWHRASSLALYKGRNRRFNTLNRTNFRRRKTDRRPSVPKVLDDAIREVQAKVRPSSGGSNNK